MYLVYNKDYIRWLFNILKKWSFVYNNDQIIIQHNICTTHSIRQPCFYDTTHLEVDVDC